MLSRASICGAFPSKLFTLSLDVQRRTRRSASLPQHVSRFQSGRVRPHLPESPQKRPHVQGLWWSAGSSFLAQKIYGNGIASAPSQQGYRCSNPATSPQLLPERDGFQSAQFFKAPSNACHPRVAHFNLCGNFFTPPRACRLPRPAAGAASWVRKSMNVRLSPKASATVFPFT